MQVDRHKILWHSRVMSVQWPFVKEWLTIFGLLGGHWFLFQFLMCTPPLQMIIDKMQWMPNPACQSWGNVWRSNNASVPCSAEWWKHPVITGMIKTFRASSGDGFVYCLLLSKHHWLLVHHLRIFTCLEVWPGSRYCWYPVRQKSIEHSPIV